MSICVPNVGKQQALEDFLNATLTLRLYSNNLTPSSVDTIASFTEVTGGGYASVPLVFANWDYTLGSPTRANYTERFTFQFTGVTTGASTVYGYYVTDSSNIVRWSERFPSAVLPYTPINGSIIRIRPRFSAGSIFND